MPPGEGKHPKELNSSRQDKESEHVYPLTAMKEMFDKESSIAKGGEDKLSASPQPSSPPLPQEDDSPLPPPTGGTSSQPSQQEDPQLNSEEHLTIHVCDNARNVKEIFVCSCDLLVREMGYFAKYLMNYPRENWSRADISVHCDVSVFTWLMRYVKRGLYQDPFGNKLSQVQSKPPLNPENIVSVLVSSDFLDMPDLVEECIDYLHGNLPEVLGTKVTLNCLSERLMGRLAAKVTPSELERLGDGKDRFKNKLYVKKLFELFDPGFSSPDCPNNASTLFRCLHCTQLLTSEQEGVVPCSTSRLSIDKCGDVSYRHEVNPGWEINTFIQQQVQQGKTCRDLYWLFWGVVNTLRCDRCGCVFKCGDFPNCWHHPQPLAPEGAGSREWVHPCCGQRSSGYTLIPSLKDGCVQCEHTVQITSDTHTNTTNSILLALTKAYRHLVCQDSKELSTHDHRSYMKHLLQCQHTGEGHTSVSAFEVGWF
jgi:hypothetical protein